MQGFKSQFSSIEEFNAAIPGWEINFQQVAAGPVKPQIDAIKSSDLIINKVAIDQTISQSGAAPEGMRTFALLTPGSRELNWCGQIISSTTLEEFAAGAEFDCRSDQTFDVRTVSVSMNALEAVAEAEGVSMGKNAFSVYQPAPEALKHIAYYTDRLLSMKSAGGASAAHIVQGLSADLEHLLVESISYRPARQRQCLTSRIAVRQRALAYLHRHDHEPISIGTLCTTIGTSWRQLNYSFNECFGMGPKAYHQQLRLRGLRRDLKEDNNARSVTELAAHWGFTHFGQLAKDYKLLFGETPSATLQNH